ncbi:Hsp20/alpha crystallin family protein [Streptomyces sp. Ag109_O5-1]|uniref:Hsp20/alpha crystallin family protein n=1 Tax=Streptomyces sp. Ag109_O5-1 TaxID=1938851 RepID=UPI000FA3A811|nr:Hsp20/alpha crystallin family protein [Streptomyces sp. Ag109_O5-1]RPE39671.1 Hsp20/alpha crystallin family protein [Streptomyces sp. Ag109_O5-1]
MAAAGRHLSTDERFLAAAGVTVAADAWSPLAGLQETNDAYAVKAEVPGIKREDIDVEISERELSIIRSPLERGDSARRLACPSLNAAPPLNG